MLKNKEFSNDVTFLKNILLAPTFISDQAVKFIKNIISNNGLEEDSTLKGIIKSVKYIQLKKQKDGLFKVYMRNNQLFNNINNKLNIDDKTKLKNYAVLLTLNVPFTSYTVI